MNKNKMAVIISILFTIVALVFGWFYLQYVMDHYLDDSEEEANVEESSTYPANNTFTAYSQHTHTL